MRKLLTTSCVIAGLMGAADAAQGQGIFPIAVEGRVGYALPQGEWNDSDELGNGFGYGINARLQLLPLISAYGGWDRYSFDAEADDGEDFDATDTGVHAGAYVSLPLSAITGVSPFAFAGIVYNSTELSFGSAGVSVGAKSDEGFGYEVGGGLAIPFAPTLTLTSQVRYRTHEATFRVAEDDEITVSYLSFDLGLKLGL